jgi:hypothetical protein
MLKTSFKNTYTQNGALTYITKSKRNAQKHMEREREREISDLYKNYVAYSTTIHGTDLRIYCILSELWFTLIQQVRLLNLMTSYPLERRIQHTTWEGFVTTLFLQPPISRDKVIRYTSV